LTVGQKENYVPNNSFEEFSTDHCGLSYSVEKFKEENYYWSCPTEGKPHMYSKLVGDNCWNHIENDSPDQPRTGNRMVMICNYAKSGFRSYVQVKLRKKILKGREYVVSLWVKVPNEAESCSTDLGILMSSTAHEEDTIYNISESATIDYSSRWTPNGWVKLESNFYAEADFEYLIIGNFKPNADTSVKQSKLAELDSPSFLFIDDVELLSLD